MNVSNSSYRTRRFAKKYFLLIGILAGLGAILAMPFAMAQGANGQNGPNNHDSQSNLDLAKFTDVPALFAAVQKAKTDANALSRVGADRPHIEKAIESLNAACSDSFTAENIDNLFQNVRQAVTSLERVNAGRVIAGNLTEAIRVATEKFLGNVERAIPKLTDTKTRENAMKDLTKSKDDYARGLALISSNRGAAINQFQQAMKRTVEYPLIPSLVQKPIVATDTELIFLDGVGNVIRRITVAESQGVSVSPAGLFAGILQRDFSEGGFFVALFDTMGNEIATTATVPLWNVFVSDSGNVALVGDPSENVDFVKSLWLYSGINLQEMSLGDTFGNHVSLVWARGDKLLIYNDENWRDIEQDPNSYMLMDGVLYYYDLLNNRYLWKRSNSDLGASTLDVPPRVEGDRAWVQSVSYTSGRPQVVTQGFDLVTGAVISETPGW